MQFLPPAHRYRAAAGLRGNLPDQRSGLWRTGRPGGGSARAHPGTPGPVRGPRVRRVRERGHLLPDPVTRAVRRTGVTAADRASGQRSQRRGDGVYHSLCAGLGSSADRDGRGGELVQQTQGGRGGRKGSQSRRRAGGAQMKMQIALNKRLKIGLLPLVLLALMGIAFVIAMVRYVSGIGAVSNLGNAYPWGFWISFDPFTGVAISSGGFLMAATVYIFELKQFKPLLRPSILTAFLGYIMVVISLLVDLGHPERIWYMMIHWNPTSVLLEIGICVMTYLTVLAIEFAPVVFEGLKWQKFAHFIHRFIMPFVILGVVLSTLHQSSLGSLLLIQPAKLYPLWWTPILPVLFFTSAITIGLGMIILESSLSGRYFKRGLETSLLEKLAKVIPIVLAIYLVIKFSQLTLAGDLQYLFT